MTGGKGAASAAKQVPLGMCRRIVRYFPKGCLHREAYQLYRCTLALPSPIRLSTSLSRAMEVSPGVVMASAPWAAP